MPLQSMTGFGAATAAEQGFSVYTEISSVNRKQLDISVSLPQDISSLESLCRQMISAKVNRGKIKCTIMLTPNPEADVSYGFNIPEIKKYLNSLSKIAEASGLRDDLTLSSIASRPELIERFVKKVRPDEAAPIVKKSLADALEKLVESRSVEGTELEKVLHKMLSEIVSLKARITKRAPEIPKEYRDKLAARIEKLGVESPLLDRAALAREVAFFADRCDISEELDRLDAHFAHFDMVMQSGEPAGRMFDFLCQEMSREVNTIGSKANDAGISSAVIDMKAKLEAVREQIQNIE